MSRTWRTDPIEKFGDVKSVEERRFRRKLPPDYGYPYKQPDPTPELSFRREADVRFRIKRSS